MGTAEASQQQTHHGDLHERTCKGCVVAGSSTTYSALMTIHSCLACPGSSNILEDKRVAAHLSRGVVL
jgi:predicted  nucleic acid-binding Zn-ribbon protein